MVACVVVARGAAACGGAAVPANGAVAASEIVAAVGPRNTTAAEAFRRVWKRDAGAASGAEARRRARRPSDLSYKTPMIFCAPNSKVAKGFFIIFEVSGAFSSSPPVSMLLKRFRTGFLFYKLRLSAKLCRLSVSRTWPKFCDHIFPHNGPII